MSLSTFKLHIVAQLIIFSFYVCGCTSTYLDTRERVIKEKLHTNETGKSRAELEKRWGDPVTIVINSNQTVTCTYEYKVMTTPDMKPWQLPGSVDNKNAIYVFIRETLPFPYYVAKDLFIRDCFKSTVTYDEQGIAITEYHHAIECNPLIFIK